MKPLPILWWVIDLEWGTLTLGNNPEIYHSITPEYSTPCGSLYVTCAFSDEGKPELVLARLGKAGGCTSALISAISALITEGMRGGADPMKLAKCLEGISCHQAGAGIESCADCFGKAITRAIELKEAAQEPAE